MESNQIIPITTDYKVVVCCMTYNHSKYIVDALNGFAMQQTDFPFACIVMDDASTDGEQEIIMTWLMEECDMERAYFYNLELSNVIIVPHQTNTNCTMAVYLLKQNLNSKTELKLRILKDWLNHSQYLAYCDGDDYWIDAEKLEKQSNCLDLHSNIDICIHSYIEKNNGYSLCHQYSVEECIIPIGHIIQNLKLPPASSYLFVRSFIFQRYMRFLIIHPTDYSLLTCSSLRGGAYYLPHPMTIYRTNVPNSICTLMGSDDKYKEKFYDKEIQMLNALDEHLNYSFHNLFVSRILLDSTPYTNSIFHNIRNCIKYKEGFKALPSNARINILLKCLFPKTGHYLKKNLEVFRKGNK